MILPLFLIALPLLMAGLLAAFRPPTWAWLTMFLGTLSTCVAVAVALLFQAASGKVTTIRVGGWEEGIAINLVVDATSALLLVLTSVVALLVIAFGLRTGAASEPYFAPLVLLLMTGVFGALMTSDLFNLFVFVEVMLLPSYGLLILAHRGRGMRLQVTATRIYVTVNLLASSIFLIGVALTYSALGQISYRALIGRATTSDVSLAGAALVLLALCMKAAVVPVHGWIGRTYPNMSPTISALFSALHTKVAVYAIFRLHSVFFGGQPVWVDIALVVFAVSMVVGVLVALGESDARAILSLHMVSQIGYILLGLAIHTPAAIAAGLFYLIHNVLAKTSLFLSTGAIETAYGRHRLGAVTGLLGRERMASLVFFVAAMALAGLPPTSGFVAKLTLITSAFSALHWVVGTLALVVSLFTLMSMLKIWDYAFLRSPKEPLADEDTRIGGALIAPAAILALATLALGLFAQPLLSLCELAADQLLNPQRFLGGH